ncbi:transporter, MscS family [Verrucomicrobiia bacterium DG1235]|nr:transporter, MscS family [Verrucomicrobiae bacterium DG1235]
MEMVRFLRVSFFCVFSAFYGLLVMGQAAADPQVEPEAVPPRELESFANAKEDAINRLSQLTDLDLGGNSGMRWLLFFVLLLATFIARKIVIVIFSRWFMRVAERTAWTFDDKLIPAMTGPIGAMVYVIGFFLSISVLSLTSGMDLVVLRIFQASTMTVLFWGLLRLVDVFAEVMVDVAKQRDMGVYHFIPLIKKTARVFLIVVAVVLVVQNLGYSVGSLLAGMGIGGLALALAAQESLANFFGSVSIVADRPFKVGDWIQVGDRVDGDVEEIGLRSTKVRTWAKSQLTIPNKVLANEIIENWSRMPKRRVKQYLGVTYSTSPENMEGLVEDIRKLLREDEGVNQDFILVNFTDFGDSALQILVYYFTSTTAWLEHMDIRQRINLKLMKAVADRGSSIAFPTRTLHIEGGLPQLSGDAKA